MSEPSEISQSVARLTRDLVDAARTLSDAEARYLVDSYYISQKDRIRAAHQMRQIGEAGEPSSLFGWLSAQSETLESQIKRALDAYTKAHPMGEWMRAVKGIGPVISAGLLAHIDIKQAPTAGHIWAFAGLDPTKKWERGKKRPHNAALKTLCWKLGESFVKVSGDSEALYGQAYLRRKEYEQGRNDAGDLAGQAADALAQKRIGKDTEAFKHYSAGKLPPGHIHARAKRWAVKLFLSHLHAEMYRRHFGKEPPAPYPIAHLGHVHWNRGAA
jgi:Transposase IS116/IS110/IS902 family